MSAPIFVLGATGIQGGFVTRHLRKADIPVHALVRDPSSSKAKALEALGVVLFTGSWDDSEALAPALKGTKAAFLNFYPSFTDPRKEFRDAETVLAAAKSAGVEHIVYSGVLGIERTIATLRSDLGSNAFMAEGLQAKKDIVDAVASIDFATHTLLFPGKFMSDFYTNGAMLYGNLSKTGVFEMALKKGQAFPFVEPDDIGAFGAAALTNPDKFAGQRIEIVTEVLSVEDAIGLVSEVTGKRMNVTHLSDAEVAERVKVDLMTVAQIVTAETTVLADLGKVKSWGIPLGSFRNFAVKEKDALKETYASLPDAN